MSYAEQIDNLLAALEAANARAARVEAQNLRLHERLMRSLDTQRQLEADNDALTAELARELARRTGRTGRHGPCPMTQATVVR